MKYKRIKSGALLWLCIGLAAMQGQNTMNVKATSGSQIPYALSGIRKLTFPSTGNMTIAKTTAATDNYVLSGVRYLKFSALVTNIVAGTEPKGKLQLYPNPVVNVVHLKFAEPVNQTATVEFLSMDGRVLYRENLFEANKLEVNVSKFRQGIYFCRVNNGVNIETTKFIKK